jgi:protein-S-isoprenylcysteine O-methyltransferase Ste14
MVLRVPSVASSLNIWLRRQSLVTGYSARDRRLFDLAWPWKLLLFGVPLLVVYAVYAYPLLIVVAGPDLLDDYLFTPTPILESWGILLIVAGRLLALATAIKLRQRRSREADSSSLHTSGVFRWSRNPGLVGMYVFCCGVWLTMPSATLLAGILVYIAYMDLKVRMEEDYLRNAFGTAYAGYQLRTGRYIP